MGEVVLSDVWIAVRCSGGKTNELAWSLSNYEIDAWTPFVIYNRRIPRKNIRKKVVVPLMPSYVFLPMDSLARAELIRDKMMCPQFKPMKFMDRFATFNVRHLDHLKSISNKTKMESIRVNFPKVGTVVKIKVGAFEGLRAVVAGNTKNESILHVENSPLELKISPFLFEIEEV